MAILPRLLLTLSITVHCRTRSARPVRRWCGCTTIQNCLGGVLPWASLPPVLAVKMEGRALLPEL